MKRIDASPEGIFEISWSPDGKWISYLGGPDEVRMAQVESGEIRVIGSGSSPGITGDGAVIVERDDEIVRVDGSGDRVIVARNDLVKDSPKRGPVVSPDGSQVLFTVCNVFDKDSQSKNAYPYRHFMGIGPTGGGKGILTGEQWYGGLSTWFPDGNRFAHFEFDSTGGARVHVVGAGGDREGTLAGLYPSVSPDGKSVAARPRSGGSLVIYSTKGGWADAEVETRALRIPVEGVTRPSATPAIWLDTRYALVDEMGSFFRLDTRRDKAEPFKKLPGTVQRRKHSAIASPDRTMLAMEVEVEGGFELRVAPLG